MEGFALAGSQVMMLCVGSLLASIITCTVLYLVAKPKTKLDRLLLVGSVFTLALVLFVVAMVVWIVAWIAFA